MFGDVGVFFAIFAEGFQFWAPLEPLASEATGDPHELGFVILQGPCRLRRRPDRRAAASEAAGGVGRGSRRRRRPPRRSAAFVLASEGGIEARRCGTALAWKARRTRVTNADSVGQKSGLACQRFYACAPKTFSKSAKNNPKVMHTDRSTATVTTARVKEPEYYSVETTGKMGVQ